MEVDASKGDFLTPMRYHGVEFTGRAGDERIGTCPLCDKPGHLYANAKNGKWSCKRCGESGNIVTFLSKIVEVRRSTTTEEDYRRLSKDRGIPWPVLKAWGLAYDATATPSRWMIPISSGRESGTLCDVRTYTEGVKGIRSTKAGEAPLGSGLFGVERMVKTPPSTTVYVCEGEFDALAFEALRRAVGEKNAVVVGVPGAGVFKEHWIEAFKRRHVVFLYDNDRPGQDGQDRAAAKVYPVAASVRVLDWPTGRPEGWDVRDEVKTHILKAPKKLWAFFQRRLRTWTVADAPITSTASATGAVVQAGAVPSIGELMAEMRTYMRLDRDTEIAFKLMLASCISNAATGSPVWLFLIGPPGAGKTRVVSTLELSDRCVLRSSINRTSLLSGMNQQPDPSLLPRLDGRILVIKDYTEVLALPGSEQTELYGILRGAYDGHVTRTFGSGKECDYKTHFSIVACTTVEIHGNSQASLGERFLKFQMVKDTSFTADEQIDAAIESMDMPAEKHDRIAEMVARFIEKRDPLRVKDRVPAWVRRRIVALSQIIAKLRAEVDRNPYTHELVRRPQHEVGTRLATQLLKLGMALSVVEGHDQINADDYAIIERVAFDTAIGFHLDVVSAIMRCGGDASRDQIAEKVKLPTATVARLMDDLTLLNVVVRAEGKNALKRGVKFTYTLAPDVRELWDKAEVGQEPLNESAVMTQVRGRRLIVRRKESSHVEA